MSRDLFGFDDPKAPDGKGMITLALQWHRDSEKAWLLSDSGDRDDAQWLPRSLATRGEGRDAGLWTLPEWKAKELGWL